MRRLFRAFMLVALPFGLIGGVGSVAAHAALPPVAGCSGTASSPGVLAGSYGNVTVTGVCLVNGGPAQIHGNLTVAPGSALVAAYAHNDQTGAGTSSLTVDGNVLVSSGAALVLGCEPEAFPCFDDASLSSNEVVHGNLVATGALGLLVHASSIGGSVVQSGGGGGVSCAPSGVFAELRVGPPYSDYEDNTIGGALTVTGLRSCWFGALRDSVGGSVIVSGNTMFDQDAMEVVTNTVSGNMVCLGNSPAVQFGDSFGSPNVVSGFALGECGFNALQPDPAPDGPLTPISVRPRM